MDLTYFSDNNFERIFECVRLRKQVKNGAQNRRKTQIFFQNENKNTDELFREIEQTCEGLIYISEADASVVAFAGQPVQALTADVILQQAGLAADSLVEERDFAEFFCRLTAIREWYGDVEKARAKKYLALQKLLEENLRELKVFKIGHRRVDIFAIGIDQAGRLTGATTRAVET